MTANTRKAREKQAREQLILKVSRELLLEHGYVRFSMDQVAQRTEYSKGTIYQHFTCKEAIMAALYLEHVALVLALLKYCEKVPVESRLRIRLLQSGYAGIASQFTKNFDVFNTVCSSPFREKLKSDTLTEIDRQEAIILKGFTGLIEAAATNGDMTLPEKMRCEELAFGIWSLCFGALSLQMHTSTIEKLGIVKIVESLSGCMDIFLDGLKWRPLSHEFDYEAALKTFEEELDQVGRQNMQ